MISDSKIFYCPSFHNFRMSFVKDFLFEVFGYQPDQVPLTDVKMCNNLDTKIMWITVGENFCRELFGEVGKLQRADISIIQLVPPYLLERRRAITKKLENIKNTVNPNLRYQVHLGKDYFRVL